MIRASFGLPPENPDEILWVSLRDMIDRQGPDPKKWAVKPYCPHCKCNLHAHDIKGALGFRVAAKEVGEYRASPGFHHPDKTAKSDCPYSFANDPRYERERVEEDTDKREAERNRARLTEPRMLRANADILNFLMQRLTGQEVASRQEQQLAGIVAQKLTPTPGLADHPWLMPYMQAMMLGARRRTFGVQETSEAVIPEVEQTSLFGTVADTPKALASRLRRGPRFREVIYDNVGSQQVEFTNVVGESRTLIVPQALRLSHVHRSMDSVRRLPLLSGSDKAEIAFPVEAGYARGIVRQARQRAADQATRANIAARLPGTRGKVVSLRPRGAKDQPTLL